MLFKQFDINANDVIIDDMVLERPSYLGVGQWIAFWEACDGCQDGEDWQAGFEQGFSEGEKQAEEDAEEEIDSLKNEIAGMENEFAAREKLLDEEYERGYEDGKNARMARLG